MRPAYLTPPAFLIVIAGLASAFARSETEEDYLTQAQAAWRRAERDRAVELAGKAIAQDPRDARAYLLRGMFYEALFRQDEAVADFDKCLERDPRNAEAYSHRGSEQFKRGKVAESLADFDRQLKLRPEDA